jgi:hypothetical protein
VDVTGATRNVRERWLSCDGMKKTLALVGAIAWTTSCGRPKDERATPTRGVSARAAAMPARVSTHWAWDAGSISGSPSADAGAALEREANQAVHRLAGPLLDCYELALSQVNHRALDVMVTYSSGSTEIAFDPAVPPVPDDLVECLRETLRAFELEPVDAERVAITYSLQFRPGDDRNGEVTISVPVVTVE